MRTTGVSRRFVPSNHVIHLVTFSATTIAAIALLAACGATMAEIAATDAEDPGQAQSAEPAALDGSDAPNSEAPGDASADAPAVVVAQPTATACPGGDDECPAVRVVPGEESQVSDGAALVAGNDWANNTTGQPGVTLARKTVFPNFLWVANHTNNTVSRVNTKTGREEGRYWVGRNPSRTAVDLDGNVWIGGRNDGRLTKVLWDVSKCPDRNEDGVIQTASAKNLGPINSEENPMADECVAYSRVPMPSLPSIRGIAAGPDGRVLFGYTAGGVQSIDPHTLKLGPHYPPDAVPVYQRNEQGTYVPVVNTDKVHITAPAGGVYGLVVDREGFLYTSSMHKNYLPRFNIYTKRWDAVYQNTGCQNYGIAIDGRDRVWLGCTDGPGGVMMFDPAKRQTHRFGMGQDAEPIRGRQPGSKATTAAVAYQGDGFVGGFGVTGLGVEPQTGDVWASFYAQGGTGRLKLNHGNLAQSRWVLIPTAPGTDLRGVGFDFEGFAWTHGVGSDRIWKINPQTNSLMPGFVHGKAVGGGGHYTYSDFTGSTGIAFTAPRAVWTFTASTPEGTSTPLLALRWEGFVPDNAHSEIRIRPLDDRCQPAGDWLPEPTDVGAAVYHGHTPGARQSVFDVSEHNLRAACYEVEVRVSTNGGDRPVVNAVDLIWTPTSP